MKKVAIIGTGIAGMGCAHELFGKAELTLYEKNDYVGGHTHTVYADEEGVPIPIDTGFMVYNEATYPRLTRLFAQLEVPTQPASMSFSVQHVESGLEFAGTGFRGLFAQRTNLLRPRYWRLLRDIQRFNTSCGEVLTDARLQRLTLGDYCRIRGYSEDFRDRYLVPMSAAVWSAPPAAMLDFPAVTLVRFFTNHRFLGLHGQLEWRTVSGGTWTYRDRLIRPFADRIRVRSGVIGVRQESGSVTVRDRTGATEKYDAAILACHADEALGLLENPDELQRTLLAPFRYQKNRATLHTDESVMPRARDAWTSWNYRCDARGSSTVYWMNSLQKVSRRRNYFVSINDPGRIAPDRVLRELDYDHPLYTLESIAAQARLPELNRHGVALFCGSYFKYGFHEDALASGQQAAQAFLERRAEA